MGTWDRNGRSRCRKEIFCRRAGRLRRMKGSAMLEAMAVILVFLVMASVLFASGRALNRQTVRTLEKNVARDGALTAVRLLAQDIMEGNRPGEEMEPEKTELEVIPEDGLGTFTVPVTVWAGEEGRNLVLYGMCAYGGQTEAVSLLLEKTEGKRRRCHAFICGSAGLEAGAVCSGRAFGGMKMGKKGYALVEAVTAVALVMMASGILSLGISFGLRMERRAEQLKNTETVWEVPARFRMRTGDGTVISGEGCVRRQTVTGRNRELFIYGFGMEPGTGELERQSLDPVFSDQRETE